MSLHDFLKEHKYSEDQILRIERGFYNNMPFSVYISCKSELDDIISWLEGDINHVRR